MPEISYWSLFALGGLKAIFWAFYLGKNIRKEIFFSGLLVTVIGLLIDLGATKYDKWHYPTSIYYIDWFGGHVPIEMIAIYFGAGSLIALVYYYSRSIENLDDYRSEDILLVWAIAGIFLWLIPGIDVDPISMFFLPLAIWALIITSVNLRIVLVIGLIAGFFGLILEVWGVLDGESFFPSDHTFNYKLPIMMLLATWIIIGLIGPKKYGGDSDGMA